LRHSTSPGVSWLTLLLNESPGEAKLVQGEDWALVA